MQSVDMLLILNIIFKIIYNQIDSLNFYSGTELADIFFLQAESEGWSISTTDRERIRKLIMRNESAFPAYGGDTSRLLYLSSLESSRSNLSEVKSTFLSSEAVEKKKTLSYRDVELGLVSLKENSSF